MVQRESGNKNNVVCSIWICCWFLLKIAGKCDAVYIWDVFGIIQCIISWRSFHPPMKASDTHETSAPVPRPATAQVHLWNNISELNSKIVSFSHLKSSGFATAENMKQVNMARLELKQSKLGYLISDAEKQKKCHAEKKALLMWFAGQNESNAAKVMQIQPQLPRSTASWRHVSWSSSSNCRVSNGRCWSQQAMSWRWIGVTN